MYNKFSVLSSLCDHVCSGVCHGGGGVVDVELGGPAGDDLRPALLPAGKVNISDGDNVGRGGRCKGGYKEFVVSTTD